MNERPIMPDLAVDSRLIGNLRRARLDFEEVDLQLEELVARCDEIIRQQKSQRIQTKRKNVAIG
ncbi:hypothetical protein [Chamaesiphon polymorphus]|uniref:Uncharacterized protein n=1 Tax=Chamaesiphon polymorphus CCALA 037 TaxID=2107692 RepID=A0A2T1GHH4_9CYAN|nr:hypothetical protein [Chamaesiphon polymorphus]PSB57144.1 hypothetical protein C7B77_09395 [Chamaesiphon polymorphus CCALA 037]